MGLCASKQHQSETEFEQKVDKWIAKHKATNPDIDLTFIKRFESTSNKRRVCEVHVVSNVYDTVLQDTVWFRMR